MTDTEESQKAKRRRVDVTDGDEKAEAGASETSPLDLIRSNMDRCKVNHVSTKTRMREKLVELVVSILTNVVKMKSMEISEPSTAQTEVEVRIGSFVTNSQGLLHFEPGVTKDHYFAMRDAVARLKQFSALPVRRICEYNFPIDDGRTHVRITCDQNEVPQAAETKKNLSTNEIRVSEPYQFRVSASNEQKIEVPKFLSPNWTIRREKLRQSYQYVEEKETLVFVDFSEVDSTYKLSNQERKTYEIEIEINSTLVPKLEGKDWRTKVARGLVQCCMYLNEFADKLNKFVFEGVPADPVAQESILQLKHAVMQWIPNSAQYSENTNPYKLRFPGSLPVALSRRHFSLIQREVYHISEKSDGSRFFLLVNPGGIHGSKGVFLIDRKFAFHRLKDYTCLQQIFCQGQTLLDGEMVMHRDRYPMFLVFDVLACNGKPYSDETLDKRLQVLRDDVITPYRKALDEGVVPKALPFQIIAKAIFPKRYARKLASSIKTINGERYYQDAKRFHKTDGIIFTPNTPYQPYGNYLTFKWKYLDQISIDWRVVESESNQNVGHQYCGDRGLPLMFASKSNEGEVVTAPADFEPSSFEKLKRELTQKNLSLTNSIVECGYDVRCGKWTFHCIRDDKSAPNYIGIAVECLLSIAENISIGELVELCERK